MNRIAPAFAAALALFAASALWADPVSLPLKGFVSSAKADLFGYYMPAHETRVGKFKLIMVALGAREDFAEFQAGKNRTGKWAPVMLVFAPLDSQPQPGEEGGVYWPNSFRVLPSAYRVTNTTIAFVGNDKALGSVSFNATIDAAALASEKKNGAGKTVMAGDLVAGAKSQHVTFTWFGGD